MVAVSTALELCSDSRLNIYVLVGSPRMSRKRKARTKKRQPSTSDRSPNQNSDSTENNEELAYLDTLPEVRWTLFSRWWNFLYLFALFSTLNWSKWRPISGEQSSKSMAWRKHFLRTSVKLLIRLHYSICNRARWPWSSLNSGTIFQPGRILILIQTYFRKTKKITTKLKLVPITAS